MRIAMRWSVVVAALGLLIGCQEQTTQRRKEKPGENWAPTTAEIARHPELGVPKGAPPGPKAGVLLSVPHRPPPGVPYGMGGGPKVYGLAGGEYGAATTGADDKH
jgi:hypothetical protein